MHSPRSRIRASVVCSPKRSETTYGVGEFVDMNFNSHSLALCLHGSSVGDADLYVMINACDHPLEFVVQEGEPEDWRLMIDTAKPSPLDIVDERSAEPLETLTLRLETRSIIVLVSR